MPSPFRTHEHSRDSWLNPLSADQAAETKHLAISQRLPHSKEPPTASGAKGSGFGDDGTGWILASGILFLRIKTSLLPCPQQPPPSHGRVLWMMAVAVSNHRQHLTVRKTPPHASPIMPTTKPPSRVALALVSTLVDHSFYRVSQTTVQTIVGSDDSNSLS